MLPTDKDNKKHKELVKKITGQHKRFVDAAKEHGCNEDEKAFEEKLKKIADNKEKKRND